MKWRYYSVKLLFLSKKEEVVKGFEKNGTDELSLLFHCAGQVLYLYTVQCTVQCKVYCTGCVQIFADV